MGRDGTDVFQERFDQDRELDAHIARLTSETERSTACLPYTEHMNAGVKDLDENAWDL